MFRRVNDKNVKFHNEVGKFRKFARGDMFSEGKLGPPNNDWLESVLYQRPAWCQGMDTPLGDQGIVLALPKPG